MNLKTPAYKYDISLLKETLEKVKHESKKYGFRVHYALKANANKPILRTIKNFGLGADCVSGNEIRRALETGFKKEDILFAGVGKTDNEILFALENGIRCLNCESLQELKIINSIAKKNNSIADIAIRINPDIDASTHPNITTGTFNNKFGINYSDHQKIIHKIKSLKNINFIGLHFHIGSQITASDIFVKLALKVNEIASVFKQNKLKISYLNLGGGLGIDYEKPCKNKIPDFENYFKIFDKYLHREMGQSIHFELGRSIVGQCGSLLTKVLYTKEKGLINYLIVDAGFTELIRPALYKSEHKIENLSSKGNIFRYSIAGPICESTDVFGKNIELPETKRGDLLEIKSAGAYGEVMMSKYNMRSKVRSFYTESTKNLKH